MTANTFQPEQQVDATALSDHRQASPSQVLAYIQEHAAKYGMAAKEERSYWPSFKKEAAAHDLPKLEFVAQPEGKQTSAKMGDEQLAVARVQDCGAVKPSQGEGPYLALVRSGMNIYEAKAAAKHIEEATGRKSFNQGEQLCIHADGTVSAKTEHDGNSVETTYGAKGGREKSVEQKNDGSRKETAFDNDKRTKTIETIPASGDFPAYRSETTWGADGKALTSVETQGDANGAHQQTTTDFTAHTTARKDVAADGSSVTTTDHGNGATSVEKRNRQGKVTNTRHTTKNGYVDTSFDATTGNPYMTVCHTNRQVGEWQDPVDSWSYAW